VNDFTCDQLCSEPLFIENLQTKEQLLFPLGKRLEQPWPGGGWWKGWIRCKVRMAIVASPTVVGGLSINGSACWGQNITVGRWIKVTAGKFSGMDSETLFNWSNQGICWWITAEGPFVSQCMGRVQPFAKGVLEEAVGMSVHIAGSVESLPHGGPSGSFSMADFSIVGTAHWAGWTCACGVIDVKAIGFGNVWQPEHIVEHVNSVGAFLSVVEKFGLFTVASMKGTLFLHWGGGTPGLLTSSWALMDPRKARIDKMSVDSLSRCGRLIWAASTSDASNKLPPVEAECKEECWCHLECASVSWAFESASGLEHHRG
jgi:hypothetical protein